MATSTREQIIELGGKIATLRLELQRIKQELRTSEAELDALLFPATIPENSVNMLEESLPLLSSALHEGSMNQRIVNLLDQRSPESMSAEQVQKLLGGEIASIRSALARLADMGKLERPLRGFYRSKRVEAA